MNSPTDDQEYEKMMEGQRLLEQRRKQLGIEKARTAPPSASEIITNVSKPFDLVEDARRIALARLAKGDADGAVHHLHSACALAGRLSEFKDIAKAMRLDVPHELISEAEREMMEALTFYPQFLAIASMPHSKPALVPKLDWKGHRVLDPISGKPVMVEPSYYERVNGSRMIRLNDLVGKGLPYGMAPRWLVRHITDELIRTGDVTVTCGKSFREFLRRNGVAENPRNINALKAQAPRLFGCSWGLVYEDEKSLAAIPEWFRIGEKYFFYWEDDNNPEYEQFKLFQDLVEVTLSFKQLICGDEKLGIKSHITPIDQRMIHRLKSPMPFDVYVWLQYRTFEGLLKKPTAIPLASLEQQFGANYNNSKEFARHFGKAIREVLGHAEDLGISFNCEIDLSKRGRLMLSPASARKPSKLIL